MKNYCLVIICINKPFNCVIRLITIMIHNIRRNNSTIFNTDKLISLFDCIFDHFIWRETTFISLRQKIFFAQNFTHTVIKLSQFYKTFLFCISDNHRNLSLQLSICRFLSPLPNPSYHAFPYRAIKKMDRRKSVMEFSEHWQNLLTEGGFGWWRLTPPGSLRRRLRGGTRALRRCAATPHPPPTGAPVSLRVSRSAGLTGHRPVIQHRGPPRGKANGGHMRS